jgi:hypothetical protein
MAGRVPGMGVESSAWLAYRPRSDRLCAAELLQNLREQFARFRQRAAVFAREPLLDACAKSAGHRHRRSPPFGEGDGSRATIAGGARLEITERDELGDRLRRALLAHPQSSGEIADRTWTTEQVLDDIAVRHTQIAKTFRVELLEHQIIDPLPDKLSQVSEIEIRQVDVVCHRLSIYTTRVVERS